mgnify:CR=1 FL=1
MSPNPYSPKLEKKIKARVISTDGIESLADIAYDLFKDRDKRKNIYFFINSRKDISKFYKNKVEEVNRAEREFQDKYNKTVDKFLKILLKKISTVNVPTKLGFLDFLQCKPTHGDLSLEDRINVFKSYFDGFSSYEAEKLHGVNSATIRVLWDRQRLEYNHKPGRPGIEINLYEENKKILINGYFKQESLDNIKEKFGLKWKGPIRKAFDKLKLPSQGTGPKINIELVKDVYRLKDKDKNLSMAEISRIKNIDPERVRFYLEHRKEYERYIKDFDKLKEKFKKYLN